MKHKSVIILRATSGAGKSFATEILTRGIGWVSVSADNYFYDKEGNYNWDGSKLKEAHQQSKDKFIEALKESTVEGIVVDNTNTQEFEFEWYHKKALEFGADVVFFVVEKRHDSEGNKHNVPQDVIDRHDNNIRKILKLQ